MDLLERPTYLDIPAQLPEDSRAKLIVELTELAVTAPSVPSAVQPILEMLVGRTAAVGSAFFQLDSGYFKARTASGDLPSGPQMDAILAHGLPSDTPLMRALEQTPRPLFFDDTRYHPAAQGFPELGVSSLAAAPVRAREGKLLGAFLMHTFRPHAWDSKEADLFGAVAGVLASLAARLVAEEEARTKELEAASAREDAIRSLGLAVEARDSETGGHTDRVTELAMQIAHVLGISGDDLRALTWGAYLHDVGKIGVPDRILHKPGKLDDGEWALMRGHAALGHVFAARLSFLPEATLQTVRHHHERWDGAGYPDGLSGEAIPLAARIFSVCDVYDALTSARPYKRAWSHEEAVAEIRAQAGTQFDPAVVAAFTEVMGEAQAD